MIDFYIKFHKERVKIDKQVFLDLLDLSPIQDTAAYIKAVDSNEISLDSLKTLATKGGIPYPLFFAPKEVIDKQIKEKDKNLFSKIPSKLEIQLTSRGKMEVKDIELIVKDLGRKQEFLKTRVLKDAKENHFIGCIAKEIKSNTPHELIATKIRELLGIDLGHVRQFSKEKVLSYITQCAENNMILISFSSFNYMPQNIDKEVSLSGICVKDKKFPYIFINTRDGDEKPKILESSGRQIFTLLSMLVCIGMGKFVLSTKTGKSKNDPAKIAYSIAGAILIPKADLSDINVSDLTSLKQAAHYFRVTPSMLLQRLSENKKIEIKLANSLRQLLSNEVKTAEPKVKHQPLPVNGYGKYNGHRFSMEVIKAFKSGLISAMEVKNVLFRRGKKMDQNLFQEYSAKFR